jgi:hypothetical protein
LNHLLHFAISAKLDHVLAVRALAAVLSLAGLANAATNLPDTLAFFGIRLENLQKKFELAFESEQNIII